MSTAHHHFDLVLLAGSYSICRLKPDESLPAWACSPADGDFVSITRTRDELSIVCPSRLAPADSLQSSTGWRCLKLAGPLDLALSGVLARLLEPLAEARCAVCPIATYDTDYLLVRQQDLSRALDALRAAGHLVHD